MNFIKYFGKLLSDKTGFFEKHCAGMIRLAFKDAGVNLDTLKIDEIKEVFSHYLKKRLEQVDIENADLVIEYLLAELKAKQGLLTMAS